MYKCQLKIYIVSKCGFEFLANVAESLTDFEDCSFDVIAVDEIDFLLEADSVVVIDRDYKALLDYKGLKKGGNIVYITNASNYKMIGNDVADLCDDLWIMPDNEPYNEKILQFNFRKTIKNMKTLSDSRKLNICFETAFDSIPDLVWFKDDNGSHLSVNNGFCKVVEKTKEQIYKRGHDYIWDIPKDEYDQGKYVCLESENIAMQTRKTCLFDEKVKTKNGFRQFKTYKSPLIDVNGEIFGTCGIAHDVTDLNNINNELEIIMKSLPFGMLLEDKNGTIINANSILHEMFPDCGEIVGQNYNTWKNKIFLDAERDLHRKDRLFLNRNGRPFVLNFREQDIIDIFDEKIGTIGIFRDVTIEYEYEQKNLHNSYTDFLTGLNNRRSLFNYLSGLKKSEQISFILLDLDNFKSVNDKFGHSVGDCALIETIKILTHCYSDDFIARLGGDEFLIVVNGEFKISEIEEKAKNLISRLTATYSSRNEFKMLSASAGIAISKLSEIGSHNFDVLLNQSDKALYSVKHKGKAWYSIYNIDSVFAV